MLFSGYLGHSPDGVTYEEVINVCRTTGYIAQRAQSALHGPEYTYPHPFWTTSRTECPECEDCFTSEAEYTHPADPLDPAPWYDAALPASTEFFGMIVSELSITKGYGPGQSRSTTSGRRARREKRVGTIRGMLVANSCAGTEYGLEWLTATLSSPANTAGDCRSGACGASVEVWRPGCDPSAGPRASGKRFLHGVTGFDVNELTEGDPDGTNTLECCQGAWVEITFEAENSRAWLPSENIATIDTSVTAAVCEDNVFDDSCVTVSTEVIRNRVSRQVRVMKDYRLCPIGWEFADFDDATDRLVIGGYETVEAESQFNGFLLSLREDPLTGDVTAYNAVTEEVFDFDTWECGIPAKVVNLHYTNPNYQPNCPECPGFFLDCAVDHLIELTAAGYVNWLTTGIDPDVWYLYDPDTIGAGTDPEATQLAAYWDCINLQVPSGHDRMQAPNVGLLNEVLAAAKASFTSEFVIPHAVDPATGPIALAIRVDVSGSTYINAINTATIGTFPSTVNPINVSYRIIMDKWPGWDQSIYEDDETCGNVASIPDFCKQTLIKILDASSPLATTVSSPASIAGSCNRTVSKVSGPVLPWRQDASQAWRNITPQYGQMGLAWSVAPTSPTSCSFVDVPFTTHHFGEIPFANVDPVLDPPGALILGSTQLSLVFQAAAQNPTGEWVSLWLDPDPDPDEWVVFVDGAELRRVPRAAGENFSSLSAMSNGDVWAIDAGWGYVMEVMAGAPTAVPGGTTARYSMLPTLGGGVTPQTSFGSIFWIDSSGVTVAASSSSINILHVFSDGDFLAQTFLASEGDSGFVLRKVGVTSTGVVIDSAFDTSSCGVTLDDDTPFTPSGTTTRMRYVAGKVVWMNTLADGSGDFRTVQSWVDDPIAT